MTVWIDEPRWWHRERWWAHLVSDTSLDELHAFAASAGLPDRAFHGDHYDVPEDYVADMIRLGATPTTSRDLVRRLRAAGLRLSPSARRAADGTPRRATTQAGP